MNWNRAKTILIFLFLAINIFLYNVLVRIDTGIETIDDEVILNSVKAAEENGVIISKELVPNKRRKNGLPELYSAASEPDKAAKRFLGKKYALQDINEEEYYFKYINKNEELVIDKHRLHYTAERGLSVPENENEAMEKAIVDLSRFGISKKNIKIVKQGKEGNKSYIVIKPCYEKCNIEGAYLKVFYDGEGIGELYGEWFDFASFKSGEEYLKDITAVIAGLKSNGEEKIKLSEAEFSYYISEDVIGGKYVSAIPVYVFKTESGEKLIFDARTGKNVNVNQ